MKTDAEYIEELKERGDALFECLEQIATNPTIQSYYNDIRLYISPLDRTLSFLEFVKADAKEWDELIRELQKEGKVGPYINGAESVMDTSEQTTEWYDQ